MGSNRRLCCQTRHGGEGTLREHQRGHRRAHAVNRFRPFPSDCTAFVVALSRAWPLFPLQTSMVRRGSTVRVRQRASTKTLQICVSCAWVENSCHARALAGTIGFPALPALPSSLLDGKGGGRRFESVRGLRENACKSGSWFVYIVNACQARALAGTTWRSLGKRVTHRIRLDQADPSAPEPLCSGVPTAFSPTKKHEEGGCLAALRRTGSLRVRKRRA